MGFLQRGFAYGNRRGFAIPLYVPELKVEEQIQYNTFVGLSGDTGGKKWAGQHFFIPPDRKIATLAFYLVKMGTPTGDVTFTIKTYPDGIVLNSKVWGDASDVPTDIPVLVWTEAEFDTPILIDTIRQVRMIVEFSGGDGENQIALCRQDGGSVKPDEEFVMDVEGSDPTSEAAYRYKYWE
ncbi:unnamed protein product [marine sediment metagenome]|uniref:Uncharacterized protein n=1 Tax=marine sediment metagenome TaxID=412755 RepID=X1Q276_9ZZZZ